MSYTNRNVILCSDLYNFLIYELMFDQRVNIQTKKDDAIWIDINFRGKLNEPRFYGICIDVDPLNFEYPFGIMLTLDSNVWLLTGAHTDCSDIGPGYDCNNLTLFSSMNHVLDEILRLATIQSETVPSVIHHKLVTSWYTFQLDLCNKLSQLKLEPAPSEKHHKFVIIETEPIPSYEKHHNLVTIKNTVATSCKRYHRPATIKNEPCSTHKKQRGLATIQNELLSTHTKQQELVTVQTEQISSCKRDHMSTTIQIDPESLCKKHCRVSNHTVK